MSESTIIAWTDHTANFWMGCTKVSAGCAHCYAETLTKNRMGLSLWGPNAPRQIGKAVWQNVLKLESVAAEHAEWVGLLSEYESEGVTGRKIEHCQAKIAETQGLLGAGENHLVFLGSLMDWAEDRPDLAAPRARMWDTIRACPHLSFQMLTKRPENIRRFLPDDWNDGYQNVWLGTSIEDMRVAERADHLRDIPAVVRFISYEPALGPLDDLDLTGIDWLIQGGESGSGFRPMPIEWARSMKLKCEAADVSYFYKQSAAYRTEMGIELDGEIVRKFPTPRILQAV